MSALTRSSRSRLCPDKDWTPITAQYVVMRNPEVCERMSLNLRSEIIHGYATVLLTASDKKEFEMIEQKPTNPPEDQKPLCDDVRNETVRAVTPLEHYRNLVREIRLHMLSHPEGLLTEADGDSAGSPD